MTRLHLLLGIVAGLALSFPAFAQEEPGGGHHAEQAAKPAAAEIHATPYAEFKAALEEAEKAASANDLKSMHKFSERMAEALKALQGTDAVKDALVAGTITKAIPIAESLDTTGDAGDMPATLEVLKKLQSVSAVLKARLPADHSENTTKQNLSAVAEGFGTLKAGEDNALTMYLTDESGAPLSPDRLQEVHTQKVHFLIADETLTDYHHVHPVALPKPGTYTASFKPKKADSYKLWADVTPVGGSQQFIPVMLQGAQPCASPCVEKKEAYEGTADGLKAVLSFEKPLKAGEADMGTVKITDESGIPVADLEPVMGAFAHIVGFYEDFATVAHVHPMGKEPASETERGGPELQFHLEPAKAGFMKLYVQVRRGGKIIFIPLGVNIG